MKGRSSLNRINIKTFKTAGFISIEASIQIMEGRVDIFIPLKLSKV